MIVEIIGSAMKMAIFCSQQKQKQNRHIWCDVIQFAMDIFYDCVGPT